MLDTVEGHSVFGIAKRSDHVAPRSRAVIVSEVNIPHFLVPGTAATNAIAGKSIVCNLWAPDMLAFAVRDVDMLFMLVIEAE